MPKYNKVDQKNKKGTRGGFRIFLGTIPNYANDKVKGVELSGVIKGGPADKAGLKGGDIIVKFASHKIENIHDYVYSLQAARPNKTTKIVVLRQGQETEVDIVPGSKE